MWHKYQQYFRQLFQKNVLFGIDFDGETIHALLLSQNRIGELSIQSYLSEKVSANDATTNNALASALKKIRTKLKHNHRNIATSLPYSSVITKKIELDAELDETEIASFIALNAESYLGQPLDRVNIDYEIKSKNINMIAAHKDRVIDHTALFKRANLFPKIIDIDIFALERSSKWLLAKDSEIRAIINIDTNRLLLCVLAAGKVLYSRAEYFSNQTILSAQEISERIVNNLQLANTSCITAVQNLVLCGNRAKDEELIEAIKKICNKPVTLANPLKKIYLNENFDEKNLKEKCSALMICLGLALRRFNHDQG